jgi:four helix bundle protein
MIYLKNMNEFHQKLKGLIDEMVRDVYKATRVFPKDEQYGATSQMRRAALSVALNYVEGFARKRRAVNRNFVETAYGSLQETKYLARFAVDEAWLSGAMAEELLARLDKIGGMLWGVAKKLEESPKSNV